MIEQAAAAGVLAGVAGTVGAGLYLRGVLRGTTVPHRGTWLIWSVLGVVAVEAQRADGARWSLLALTAQSVGTCLVFALSVRFGTGGLSRPELALIGLAGVGVICWRVTDQPVVATSCVIAADLVAAAMMVPKTWRVPHSETVSMFVIAAAGGALTAVAVGSLSGPLLLYPVYFSLVNAAVAAMVVYRRAVVAAPLPVTVTMRADSATDLSLIA